MTSRYIGMMNESERMRVYLYLNTFEGGINYIFLYFSHGATGDVIEIHTLNRLSIY